MSYRFLPWVRRGLAAQITEPDPLGDSIPARASFPVSISATGGTAEANLRLYGPGDVVGLDTRSILRVEPKRGAGNFPPDQFAAVEFDPPDLPWMFTPASAASSDRLRPWLVLIVVEKQDGVSISVSRQRPLPLLTIENPAVPTDELPDLADSWAWAHAQMVESNGGGNVSGRLKSEPDLNISRIVCPRRLEPDRTYIACLVPAFEAGVLAGLGQPVPETADTAPAWKAGSVAPTLNLPLYFHWEFRTGRAGDFESLARKLRPQELPDEVGSRPMFIGAADPALPQLPPSQAEGGIVELEGALRAPKPGSGPSLTTAHDPFVNRLTELLDAPANYVDAGAPASASLPAENVGPAIYGSWHARTHRIPGANGRPRWLRELNVDPRHRAAAGLGTEVVKVNQERFMDAAWEQVGDVIAANQALNISRLMDQLSQRVLDRHLRPLPPTDLFGITTPMHALTMLDELVVSAMIGGSVMPEGLTDPSFRRMASPQGSFLKRAARFADAAAPQDGTVAIGVIDLLAAGDHRQEFNATLDGIASSRLLERLPDATGEVVEGAPLGLPGNAKAQHVAEAKDLFNQLVATPTQPVAIRPEISGVGVIVDSHIARIAVAALEGDSLRETVGEIVTRRIATPGSVGFLVSTAGEGVEVLEIDDGDVLRGRRPGGIDRAVARLSPDAARLDARSIRDVIGRVPAGTFDPSGAAPVIDGGARVEIGDSRVTDPFIAVGSTTPTVSVDAPITEQITITEFIDSYQQLEFAAQTQVAPLAPEPAVLDLDSLGSHLIAAIDPHETILARAATRITVGSVDLGSLSGVNGLRQAERLAPIMVGPTLDEPLYRSLAQHNQDRFLPGAGKIPPNAITLMETNPRFVEAFMVGANHEMNRELLWRAYPTDRRGTPFHMFWDRLDGGQDIGPIHLFGSNNRLGKNSLGQIEGSLVLIIRGDLLRRYPNSVVYATPSGPDNKVPPNPTVIETPVFAGKLDPDITFVGFDLTAEQISPDPGWFFVIQEQPTEPRFGLDVPSAGTAPLPATWADLSWAHANVAPGGHLSLSDLSSSLNLTLIGTGPRMRWGQDAAQTAAITFQRPFRAAVHGREILAIQNGQP